jgi:hypothetical protein
VSFAERLAGVLQPDPDPAAVGIVAESDEDD